MIQSLSLTIRVMRPIDLKPLEATLYYKNTKLRKLHMQILKNME